MIYFFIRDYWKPLLIAIAISVCVTTVLCYKHAVRQQLKQEIAIDYSNKQAQNVKNVLLPIEASIVAKQAVINDVTAIVMQQYHDYVAKAIPITDKEWVRLYNRSCNESCSL